MGNKVIVSETSRPRCHHQPCPLAQSDLSTLVCHVPFTEPLSMLEALRCFLSCEFSNVISVDPRKYPTVLLAEVQDSDHNSGKLQTALFLMCMPSFRSPRPRRYLRFYYLPLRFFRVSDMTGEWGSRGDCFGARELAVRLLLTLLAATHSPCDTKLPRENNRLVLYCLLNVLIYKKLSSYNYTVKRCKRRDSDSAGYTSAFVIN